MKEKIQKLSYFWMGFLLVLGDLVLKYLIRLFDGFYICNHGISWGIILPKAFFWLIWVFFLIFFIFLFQKSLKHKKSWSTWCLILILGGTFGNFFDRIIFGCVTDFIKIPIISFPIFNLADVFIVIGCFFLFLTEFKFKKRV